MTYQHKRAIKVLKEDNKSAYYHSEIQILTGYLFEMIFTERSGMCEGSYGESSSTIEIQ